jgi:hypothetical protein
VRLQSAATVSKLRETKTAPAAQEKVLHGLTSRLAATSYWKQAGIEAGMSYRQFQSRVPLQTYDQLAPAIGRMQSGESNVLWPGPCSLFGLTSGTSTGQPRWLPMTDDLLEHFRRAGFEAMLYYTTRVQHLRAFGGRHLLYTSPAALTSLDGGRGALGAETSGVAALHLAKWMERHFYEPGGRVAQMSDADPQLEAIASRARSRNISVIAGVPPGMTSLCEMLRAKCLERQSPDVPLKRHWPNLECLVHTGASISPYAAQLRALLGATVAFHEVYAASEGFIAAQDDAPIGLRLMTDMGVFFEFVPISDYDSRPLNQLGPKAHPIEDVKTGIEYAVIITTPGGLARYVLGDVVRFSSVTPPRLVHVGGTELRLNAFNENVTERGITEALVALCDRRNWTLVNFHVAPLFANGNFSGPQRQGRHEWWVELKPGTFVTPTGPQMAAEVDPELQRSNAAYAAQRAAGIIDAPVVRLVMPGVFEHWLRFHRKWGGQHKMPRCRSDRLVADEFAQITNFARD